LNRSPLIHNSSTVERNNKSIPNLKSLSAEKDVSEESTRTSGKDSR
jgi:hypothetical protein